MNKQKKTKPVVVGRRYVIENNAVSEMVKLNLGGYEQKVLIEGKSENLPVLITLHGGPGFPVPFNAGCRGMFPEFTDKCILVSWDQLGCGINHSKLPEDITVNDFADMTADLIDAVKKRFPANKVYLFGMSWGSVLAVKAAARKAYALSGVLVYGQILRDLFQTDDVRQAIMNSNASKTVKKMTTRIFESDRFTPETLIRISNYIKKYTNGYYVSAQARAQFRKLMAEYMASTDYTLGDYLAITSNPYSRNRSLLREFATLDLSEELSQVRIPYRILQGENDIISTVSMIRDFCENSGNRMLSCTVVSDSSHLPGQKAMEAILRETELMNRDDF